MSVVTRRGHRGRYLGRASYIAPPAEYRGPTNQTCGLYPFAVGAGIPNIGVPLGQHQTLPMTGCFDPISGFTDAHLISQPSLGILGIPGVGKSTLVRRMMIGLAPTATPLVLGDLKAEYVRLVRALGGQVITLGRGTGALNILDTGALDDAARQLGGTAAAALQEEAHGRRLNMVRALLAVIRERNIDDHEAIALNAALRQLNARWKRRRSAPLLHDLIQLVKDAPQPVRDVVLDHGDDLRYRELTDPLVRSLIALCDGPLGQMFARQTTDRLRLDAPAVCIDISSINDTDRQLQAGALLACWNAGFGSVWANNTLADAGAIPQRHFLIVVDELWQVLQAGSGLTQQVNALTRLNRDRGVGHIYITHSGNDMDLGFLERSGAIACFGLPRRELDTLNDIVDFTDEERKLITSWSTPSGWGEADEPPGRGKFILKIGGRPGVPLRLTLVPSEIGLNNTSRRWGQ